MKKQYSKPLIRIEELLKQDILLLSEPSTDPENKIGSDDNSFIINL